VIFSALRNPEAVLKVVSGKEMGREPLTAKRLGGQPLGIEQELSRRPVLFREAGEPFGRVPGLDGDQHQPVTPLLPARIELGQTVQLLHARGAPGGEEDNVQRGGSGTELYRIP